MNGHPFWFDHNWKVVGVSVFKTTVGAFTIIKWRCECGKLKSTNMSGEWTLEEAQGLTAQ